jgi:hypothetical protein
MSQYTSGKTSNSVIVDPDTGEPYSSGTPMPVSASIPGVATEATLSQIDTTLGSLDSKVAACDTTALATEFTVGSLDAKIVACDTTTLATEFTLGLLDAKVTACDTTTLATEATLSGIDTKLNDDGNGNLSVAGQMEVGVGTGLTGYTHQRCTDEGCLCVVPRCKNQALPDGASNTQELPKSCSGGYVVQPTFQYVYNGSTWDRMRGSTSGLTITSSGIDSIDTKITACDTTALATESTLSTLNGKVTACDTTALATEATLSTLNGKVTACDTTALATEATLSNCETLLTSIDTNTGGFSKYDPQLALSNEEITGAKRVVVQARGAGTTTACVISNVPSGYPVITNLPLTTPESWEIVSVGTNAAMDTSAGVGAQEVTLVGIDGSGAEATDTKELNGTTPVNFDGTWLCANSLKVTRCGSSMLNEGDLVLRVQGTTTGSTRAYITVDTCRTNLLRYRAPSGKKLFLRKLLIYSFEYGVIHNIDIKSYNPSTNVYQTVGYYTIADSNSPMEIDLGGESVEAGSEVVIFSSLTANTFTYAMDLIMDQA